MSIFRLNLGSYLRQSATEDALGAYIEEILAGQNTGCITFWLDWDQNDSMFPIQILTKFFLIKMFKAPTGFLHIAGVVGVSGNPGVF